MSYALLRQIIETDISTAGLNLSGAAAVIKFDGVGSEKEAPYISVMIEDAGRIPCVGNTQWRYLGNVIFDIVIEVGKGTASARQCADEIATRYGNIKIGSIQYGTIYTSRPTENRFRVIVPYQFDN